MSDGKNWMLETKKSLESNEKLNIRWDGILENGGLAVNGRIWNLKIKNELNDTRIGIQKMEKLKKKS